MSRSREPRQLNLYVSTAKNKYARLCCCWRYNEIPQKN